MPFSILEPETGTPGVIGRQRRHGLELGLIVLLVCCLGCRGDSVGSGWTAQELGTDAEFKDVFFLDSERGWIVGGGHPVEGGIVGSTVDGGRTWSFSSGLIRGQTRPESVHLRAVQFLDEHRGFIVGSAGYVLRTVDGGEHWHPVHRGGRHLADLQFVDLQTGWAVGGSTLIRTEDGGDTWASPMPGGSELPFSARAIQFLDRDRGWGVGVGGAIYGTTDGGESWSQLIETRSGEPGLWALRFVDTERGWVVGEGGTILRTEDGGQTWSRQETPTSSFLTGVHFLDPTTGWAAGFDRSDSSSVILHTQDGGSTWRVQLPIEGQALFALAFTESGFGWAAGERVRPHPQRLFRYAGPSGTR